jgi:hypothetical protein
LATVTVALSFSASNVLAQAIQTSICDLASRPGFYDGKLVVLRALVRGSGLHPPLLVDRRCKMAPRTGIVEEARTRHEHVDHLMSAVHDAFFSSTLNEHRYAQAIFLGTFIAKPLGSSNMELRLGDVYSVKIVEDNDLVPNLPPPPAH